MWGRAGETVAKARCRSGGGGADAKGARTAGLRSEQPRPPDGTYRSPDSAEGRPRRGGHQAGDDPHRLLELLARGGEADAEAARHAETDARGDQHPAAGEGLHELEGVVPGRAGPEIERSVGNADIEARGAGAGHRGVATISSTGPPATGACSSRSSASAAISDSSTT